VENLRLLAKKGPAKGVSPNAAMYNYMTVCSDRPICI